MRNAAYRLSKNSRRKNEETTSPSMLVERFVKRIPGFNRFQLSFSYLIELSEAYGIKVLQIPLDLHHGQWIISNKRSYIVINSEISAPLQVIGGFHEFAHVTDHAPLRLLDHYSGGLCNIRKFERQAQIIGVMAYMPDTEILGLSSEDLMRRYGISREIAMFRLSLMLPDGSEEDAGLCETSVAI